MTTIPRSSPLAQSDGYRPEPAMFPEQVRSWWRKIRFNDLSDAERALAQAEIAESAERALTGLGGRDRAPVERPRPRSGHILDSALAPAREAAQTPPPKVSAPSPADDFEDLTP